MAMLKTSIAALVLALAPSAFLAAQTATPASASNSAQKMSPGSKIFIEPMDGFETTLAAGILKKKVPVVIVDAKEKADFVITGTFMNEKAGWAKTIFISPAPHAAASISVKNSKSGDLVFAYNVDKSNAARGNQSTAEACAKHLKEFIEKQ